MIEYEDWNIEEMTGYKPLTTFYSDFSIAENFDAASIKDTYDRSLDYFKDYKVATEIVMVLNWKMWRWEKSPKLCRLYHDLWQKATKKFETEFSDNEEAMRYFYRTTD